MIVATAGHIDHGKTLLVKALTGIDTDRLTEEKARGISIDLGFAYIRLAQGGLIGFVDVPGHQRFIHNMLAGVCGIDFALLVVAADDGVMPQTMEHVQILNLLGLDRGIAVITKTDRVAPQRVQEVETEVRALLAGTTLASSAVLPISSVTRLGIDRLRALLTEAAALPARFQDGQNFRFAVDRSFTQAGSGTVVTGTVFNGEVRPNTRLTILPQGTSTRVRSIQIHGEPAERARAGERCALNLAQTSVESVGRGNWVVAEAIAATSQRMEVRLTLLSTERAPLKHGSAVHLHLGTADVMARIATRAGVPILPGTTAWAQLVLGQPIAAINGDRFILRDPSASRTLGGGRIVDPYAPPARRRGAERPAVLAALECGDLEAALPGLLAIPAYAIDCAQLEKTFDATVDRAAALYRAAAAVVLGREQHVAIAGSLAASLREQVLERVAAFHRRQPQAPGIEVRTLHREFAPWLSGDHFLFLLRESIEARRLTLNGAMATLPGHDPTSNAADGALWIRAQPLLLEGGFTPPGVAELSKRLETNEGDLAGFLHRKCKAGELLRIGDDLYYPKTTLAVLAANAALVARGASRGLFTAAQYRDATGIGRNLTIRILEFFDTLGITQRVGNQRRMRNDFVPLLGAAKPALKPRPRAPASNAGQTACRRPHAKAGTKP